MPDKVEGQLEYEGYWWLPDAPETTLVGTLRFTPGKEITLTFFGTFLGDQDPLAQRTEGAVLEIFRKADVLPYLLLGRAILGENWKDITLLDLSFRQRKYGGFFDPNHSRTIASVRYALIGEHFATRDDIRMHTFRAYLTNVASWLRHAPFRLRRDGTEAPPMHVVPAYRDPEFPTFDLDKEDAHLTFEDEIHQSAKRFQMTLTSATPLKLTVATPRRFEWFLQQVGSLQMLLSLLIGYPAQIVRLRGFTRKQVLTGGGKEVEIDAGDVEIFYHARLPWASEIEEKQHTLTSFTELQDSFQGLLSNWLEHETKFGRAITLFNANLFEDGFYTNLKFLTMAQALEAAHRNLYGDSHFSNEDQNIYRALKDELIEKLPDAISPDFRQSIVTQLEHLPHDGLRRRLVDACKQVKLAIAPYITAPKDFAGNVKDSRDYFSHYSKSLEDKAADGAELLILTYQLEVLLTSLFLKELGVDEATLAASVSGFDKYKAITTLKGNLGSST